MSRRLHSILAASAAVALTGLALVATDHPAAAAPVEYVKVCNLSGIGYFYIPGTDMCADANAIGQSQSALQSFSTTAYQGVAISSAIVAPFMPSNANFAVSAHWATFSGQNALGLGGLMRAGNTNLFLSGGVGVATNGGSPIGRAGFMFAW